MGCCQAKKVTKAIPRNAALLNNSEVIGNETN